MMTDKRQRIAEEIARSGYTQQEIADALGITRGAVGHWCAGRTEPNSHLLTALADFLGVSAAYLRSGEGERKAPISDLFATHESAFCLRSDGLGTRARMLKDLMPSELTIDI